MTKTTNRTFGAVLLISGTAIGAGMLALPVVTAPFGFFPTLILYLVSWLAMTYASLLLLEANLWFEQNVNLISMCKKTLGGWGQALSWFAYLLLLYSLMSAYLSGISAIAITTLDYFFNIHLYPIFAALGFIFFFGLIIYLGTGKVDYLNRLLMVVLVIGYILLIVMISPHVNVTRLMYAEIKNSWFTLPIIITAFGFQIIIPSLRYYLESDAKKVRLAVLIGGTIPLVIYIIWEILILGALPREGHNGLLAILASGQPATGLTSALEKTLKSTLIDNIMNIFAFAAIATSFIGVSMSLFDFLADGFGVKKTYLGRLMMTLLTFLPPIVFILLYPQGFILALGFAGIFVAVLLILLPAFMVISGRYYKKLQGSYRVKGGLFGILLLIIFAVMVIVFELIHKLGRLG